MSIALWFPFLFDRNVGLGVSPNVKPKVWSFYTRKNKKEKGNDEVADSETELPNV